HRAETDAAVVEEVPAGLMPENEFVAGHFGSDQQEGSSPPLYRSAPPVNKDIRLRPRAIVFSNAGVVRRMVEVYGDATFLTEVDLCHPPAGRACWPSGRKSLIHVGVRDDAILWPPC